MYNMKTKVDCGLAAQAFVRSVINKTSFDEEYEKLNNKWKMPKSPSFLSDFRDFPGTHYRMMTKDKISWKLIIPETLLLHCVPNQTIALLHGLTIQNSPTLDQHWAVIKECNKDFVTIHIGNGKSYQFPYQKFRSLYYRGWPNCMYVMGEGETGQHRIEQFIDWCLSWII